MTKKRGGALARSGRGFARQQTVLARACDKAGVTTIFIGAWVHSEKCRCSMGVDVDLRSVVSSRAGRAARAGALAARGARHARAVLVAAGK